jgi:alkylation response protein AidB-like acyl-CoA dehydrogenase
MTGATATERAELLEMAGELARRELAPHAGALDADEGTVLAGCWRQLADVGLDRALLSEERGGSGLGVGDLLAAIEELATGDGGIALCVLLSNAALVTLPAEQAAAVPVGARWALIPVRFGPEVTVCDGRLDGSVGSALGAYGTDGIVLAVEGDRPASIAVVADTPGLMLERDEEQMGLRGAPAASVGLAGIEAHADPTSSDAPDLTGTLALLRAGTAAIARGITRRAYEMALEYAKARRQGGVAIIEHDAVSDMLAAMAVRLSCPLPTVGGAAEALAAKIAATDAAVASTTDAVQVFGGTGYMRETGIEKLMRDAKYCQLFPEPNWVAQDELMRLELCRRR